MNTCKCKLNLSSAQHWTKIISISTKRTLLSFAIAMAIFLSFYKTDHDENHDGALSMYVR